MLSRAWVAATARRPTAALVSGWMLALFLMLGGGANAAADPSAATTPGTEVTGGSTETKLLVVFTTGLTIADSATVTGGGGAWQEAIFRPQAGLGAVTVEAGASRLLTADSAPLPTRDPGPSEDLAWWLGWGHSDAVGLVTLDAAGQTFTDGASLREAAQAPLGKAVAAGEASSAAATGAHRRPAEQTRPLLIATVPAGHAADIGALTSNANERGWDVAVVPVADQPSGANAATALWFGYLPADAAGGLIDSPSLRSTGLVGIEDVRGVFAGQPRLVRSADGTDTEAQLADQWAHAQAARDAQPIWYAVFGGLAGIGMIATAVHFVRRPSPRSPTFIWRNLALWNTTVFATIPTAIALNAAPWWRLPRPYLTIIALTVVGALGLALAAHRWSRLHPLVSLSALTVSLIAVDLIGATGWLRDSLFGSLTVQFARLYGVSNRIFVVLVVSGLALLTLSEAGTERRLVGRATALCAALVTLDALPAWGADFGGTPGLVAAFIVATVGLRRGRLRWQHAALWVTVTALILVTVSAVDACSDHPTHIGRFARQVWRSLGVVDTAGSTVHSPAGATSTSGGGASQMLLHKLHAMLATITTVPLLTVAGLALLIGLVWAWGYARRTLPHHLEHRLALAQGNTLHLKAMALGLAAAALCGAVLNDSGIIVVADAVAIGGSALAAAFATNLWRARRDGEASQAEDGALRTG